MVASKVSFFILDLTCSLYAHKSGVFVKYVTLWKDFGTVVYYKSRGLKDLEGCMFSQKKLDGPLSWLLSTYFVFQNELYTLQIFFFKGKGIFKKESDDLLLGVIIL